MENAIINPLETLTSEFAQFELITRVYLARPVLGKMNAIAIGQARKIIAANTVTDGGIDDPLIAELRLRTAQREPIVGFDVPMEPEELIGRMLGAREELTIAIDPMDEAWAGSPVALALGSLKSTLDFMCKEPTIMLGDKLAGYAVQLGVSVEVLRNALAKDRARNAERLRNDRDAILDIINSCEPLYGEFEQLPFGTQAQLYQSIDQCIDRSFEQALSTVLRANNRMGDVKFLQEMKRKLKEWNDLQMKTNPDYALRVLGL